MKTTSWTWTLVVGLLSVTAQLLTFYVRFGRWNADSTFVDYLLFFFAGALGGWILTYFLKRQPSSAQRRAVLIAFLLATPFALVMMLAGGLLGWIGILIFPQIPWALFTGIGAWVGRLMK